MNPLRIGILIFGFAFSAANAATTFFSTLNQPLTNFNGFDTTLNRFQASDFMTSSEATIITGVTANLYNADDRVHTLTAYIFSNSAFDTPGTLVGTFDSLITLPVGVVSGDVASNASDFSATDAGILLSPNTKYWFALSNSEANHANAAIWTTSSSRTTDPGSTFTEINATELKIGSSSAGPWLDTVTGDFKFSLSGLSAPEPSRIMLVGIGFVGALLRRRRQ